MKKRLSNLPVETSMIRDSVVTYASRSYTEYRLGNYRYVVFHARRVRDEERR